VRDLRSVEHRRSRHAIVQEVFVAALLDEEVTV